MSKMKIWNWETHLVLRAQQGETIAFELLADTHRSTLKNHAQRMLRNHEDASDAVQETLIKAFRAIRKFQIGRPVLPWLQRICTNCCIDMIRDRHAQHVDIEKHEYSLSDSGQEISSNVESRLDQELIWKAVDQLPTNYREIVKMRHLKLMDVDEIAQKLNKPEGTIKSWLFRARAKLRKDLGLNLGQSLSS